MDPSRPSSQEQAYRHIRRRIREGRLGAGVRVKPEEVAAELGLSRMPVREAIRQLDAEGLLTIRANRGAVVTALTPAEADELFEMWAVLAAHLARLLVEAVDEDRLDELALRLARLGRAASAAAWLERLDAFHDSFARLAGRPRFAAEIARLRLRLEPRLRLVLADTPPSVSTTDELRRLLDALARRDAKAARKAMRQHILGLAAVAAPGPG